MIISREFGCRRLYKALCLVSLCNEGKLSQHAFAGFDRISLWLCARHCADTSAIRQFWAKSLVILRAATGRPVSSQHGEHAPSQTLESGVQ
jgi:hypothetical protein